MTHNGGYNNYLHYKKVLTEISNREEFTLKEVIAKTKVPKTTVSTIILNLLKIKKVKITRHVMINEFGHGNRTKKYKLIEDVL